MYFTSGQCCVRQDLIVKELDVERHGCEFRPLKLTSRFISWLFRHYRVEEYSINIPACAGTFVGAACTIVFLSCAVLAP